MEKLIDEGGAAFPCAMSDQSILNQGCEPFQIGMTLRDYYAGKALVGFLSEPLVDGQPPTSKVVMGRWKNPDESPEDYLATSAFKMADAMIKARYRQDISDR